jgi:hypothetical protein
MTILIFTPTCGDGPRAETLESVKQQTYTDYVHEVSWLENPLPGRRMENVISQYQRAWKMALDGGYDALLTFEHDMVMEPDAVQKLYETDAPVVYGVYMLRHGQPTLSAWQYINNKALGMSLSLYPNDVRKGREQGWLEVCGVGWGCTLIRREVLERVTVRSTGASDAGDMAFASDCVRGGIKQIARFDVPCQHIMPDGTVLHPYRGGIVARVLALQTFNAGVGRESIPMKKGRYYTIPPEDARELQRAGYVKITNMDGDLDQFDKDFDISGREVAAIVPEIETAVATVTKRKPKKGKNAD